MQRSSAISVTAPPGRARSTTRAGWLLAALRDALDPVRILGILAALFLWQLASLQLGPAVLPPPLTVADTILDNFFYSRYLESHQMSRSGAGYVSHLAFTVRNVLIGVFVGGAIGITLGLASVRSRAVNEIVTPIAATFGTAPIVVAVPFFLIWFGIISTAQILMVAFYTSLLLYIYSRAAASNIPPEYTESALTLGARPRSIFRWIYVPGSVPEITAGLRVALAGSWGLAAVAELLGSQIGAGLLIKFYASAFVLEGMLALTIILGIVAILFDRLLVLVTQYVTRWRESGHQLQL